MPAIEIRHLGDYIREQRSSSNISLRQLAKLAGVSNPYLSQIERGLRKPSAEILQQIAKALRISAEALYVQAGILEQRAGDGIVVDCVLADEGLNERQKQVLLEIYDSFRRENVSAAPPAEGGVAVSVVTATGSTEQDAAEQVDATPAARAPRAATTAAARTSTRPKSARTPARTEPADPAAAATTDSSGGSA